MEKEESIWGDPIEAARRAWEGLDIEDLLPRFLPKGIHIEDELDGVLEDAFCTLILDDKIPDDCSDLFIEKVSDCEWSKRSHEEFAKIGWVKLFQLM